MLPTPSKSPWFEQGSSFISLEDIMVGVQFTPRQRASMVLRFAERHSAVQVQQEFRRRFGRAPPTPVTIRNNFKKYRDEGTSQNLCKQRSGRSITALCVSANLRTVKALLRGVNCTPTMMSSKLINEDPVQTTVFWMVLVTLSTMFIH